MAPLPLGVSDLASVEGAFPRYWRSGAERPPTHLGAFGCKWNPFLNTVNQGCGLGLDVSVSRRSRDLSKVSSRSSLGHVGKRLGLVSVSGAKVSVLVSVSTV